MTAFPDDKLSTLEGALPRLATALEERRLGYALEKATETLRGFDLQLSRFTALTASAERLRDYLVAARKDIAEAIEEAEEFGDLMSRAADKEQLEAVVREAGDLGRAISRLHRAVLGLVDRYVTARLVPLGSLGLLLERMGQEELGAKLQYLQAEGRATAAGAAAIGLPERLAALDEGRVAVQRELTELSRDPEVDTFLLALGSGETSLSLVTPAVLRWLSEHKALGQFRVLPAE